MKQNSNQCKNKRQIYCCIDAFRYVQFKKHVVLTWNIWNGVNSVANTRLIKQATWNQSKDKIKQQNKGEPHTLSSFLIHILQPLLIVY